MPLGLISLLSGIKSLGGSVLSFLGKLNIWQLCCIALALIATVQTLRLHAEQRHSTKLSEQVAKCDAARRADRQSYVTAQQQAQAANKAQVQKIESQQQKVTTDVETDYRNKLAILERELRAQSAAPQGHPGGPGVSGVPHTPGGSDGQAGVPLSPDERLRAAQNELQLDELITWVEQQEQVKH